MIAAADHPVPALPPAGRLTADTPASAWNSLRDVPLRLSVDIPLPPMSLRALAALRPGQMLPSSVPTSDDLIVTVGGSPIAQARFEFLEGRMALRMTRLLGAPRTAS